MEILQFIAENVHPDILAALMALTVPALVFLTRKTKVPAQYLAIIISVVLSILFMIYNHYVPEETQGIILEYASKIIAYQWIFYENVWKKFIEPKIKN